MRTLVVREAHDRELANVRRQLKLLFPAEEDLP